MFLFLFALVSTISGEVLNCDGWTDIDLSRGPVSIPKSGAIGMLPIGTKQNCTFQLTVPTGKYATLKVTSQIPASGTFMVYNPARTYNHVYSIAGTSDLPAALNTTFYLPGDKKGIFIQLSTIGTISGFFSFTAELHNLPVLPKVNQLVSDQVMVDLATLKQTMYIFQGPPGKLFLFRVAAPGPDFRYDSCFVYNGANPQTSDFILGLAGQVEGIPVSLFGPCAVLCLGTDFAKAQLVIAPPPASMPLYSSWTIRTGNTYTATLYGLQDNTGKYPYPSYLTTYCAGGCDEYLQRASSLTRGAPLTLYSGSPTTQLKKIESFSIDWQTTYLPQKMSGVWNTFVVENSMSASLTIGKDRTDGWEVAGEGRKGVFETTAYGQRSTAQNTSATFAPSSKRMITFLITTLDFNSTTDYLQLTVDRGSGSMQTSKITSRGPTSEIVKGYSLKLDYVQGSQYSVGGLFQFEMSSSGGAISFLLAIISTIYFIV